MSCIQLMYSVETSELKGDAEVAALFHWRIGLLRFDPFASVSSPFYTASPHYLRSGGSPILHRWWFT